MTKTAKQLNVQLPQFKIDSGTDTTTTPLRVLELKPVFTVNKGMVDIDDLFEELSKDESFAKESKAAGLWVAETYYPGESSLKTIRLKSGLSQKQLATLIGTQQPMIARMENGDTNSTIDTIEKLAAALNANPLDLYKTLRKARYG